MALKYYFEFTTNSVKPDNTYDIVTHKVEIYNDDYIGDSTLVYGTCSLTKASTKDTLEPIRGGGLKIDLEASTDLDFTDLYSEEERTFYVKYYRNETLHSLYWLDPEGLYQSFVENEWIISLDCTDGLGFLNNLSYVDNTTKEKFTGKQSQLEVIVNCLKRTGFEQNIYVKTDLFYEDLSVSENSIANTYVNAFRYVKDDGTTMQCNEVLSSVLESHSLIITQRAGSWFICKPNNLYIDSEIEFFAYDYNGIALNPTKLTVDFSQDLGSQINNYYPHHINENQQISIDNSIGAYRINYKYGLTNSFYENLELENVAGVIDEWTVNDATKLTFPSNDRGVILESRPFSSSDNLILSSDSISLTEQNQVIYLGKIINLGATGVQKTTGQFRSRVVLTGTSSTYYLDYDGSWTTSNIFVTFQPLLDSEYTYEIKTQPLPVDGDLKIELYQPRQQVSVLTTIYYQVNESTIIVSDELGDLKGETHTFQRASNPSSKIGKNKEVFNGDSLSELYVGTLYKNDETTPTDFWFKNTTNVRLLPILQWMGEDRMDMYSKPFKIFKGDCLGYIDYLSVISINNITGLFMPIEWSYDAANNITKMKLKEIFAVYSKSSSDLDIDYSLQLNYGDVSDPTIKN